MGLSQQTNIFPVSGRPLEPDESPSRVAGRLSPTKGRPLTSLAGWLAGQLAGRRGLAPSPGGFATFGPARCGKRHQREAAH